MAWSCAQHWCFQHRGVPTFPQLTWMTHALAVISLSPHVHHHHGGARLVERGVSYQDMVPNPWTKAPNHGLTRDAMERVSEWCVRLGTPAPTPALQAELKLHTSAASTHTHTVQDVRGWRQY